MVKDRLLEFLAYLGIGQTKFEQLTGLSRGLVDKMSDGITARTINKISKVYPELNIVWLQTGEGQMLKSGEVVAEEKGIPYYDMDVTASITESFHDMREEVQYYINYPPLNDCDAAFPVYGDSMVPDFYPGEVILVREIRNVDSMLWGEPYLVITNADCDNLRTIKNVYLSEDRQKFILRATNPRYAGDTIVPRDSVIKIFLVKGKLNRRQL